MNSGICRAGGLGTGMGSWTHLLVSSLSHPWATWIAPRPSQSAHIGCEPRAALRVLESGRPASRPWPGLERRRCRQKEGPAAPLLFWDSLLCAKSSRDRSFQGPMLFPNKDTYRQRTTGPSGHGGAPTPKPRGCGQAGPPEPAPGPLLCV